NFLPFQPGLVGGHCIGVDPFYLAHVAQATGLHPEIVLAGRRINDGMGAYIAQAIHDNMGKAGGRVLMLGLTFKENIPDLRNSRVVDIIAKLRELGHEVEVHDPHADPAEAKDHLGIDLVPTLDAGTYDVVIGAVKHREYEDFDAARLESLVAEGGILADIKGIWRDVETGAGVRRWQL
ncbi:MAG: UDP binding domain-containing protein, partial [Alphaproteobacteria bacterium]